MQQPDNKASLLRYEKGLENVDSPLLMERYKKTYSGNKAAIKLFENGEVYELFTTKFMKLDDEGVMWKKAFSLSEEELKEFKDVFESYVKDYINNPSQEIQGKPKSASDWYFHLDKEYYAYSQNQRWRFDPKWVRKMNNLIER